MKNYKKMLAGLAAFAVLLNVNPVLLTEFTDSVSLTASAAVYTTVKYGDLTCYHYGDYIVIADCTAGAEHVEIPAEIDGVPVTEIGTSAFEDCTMLTAVTIPDSVWRIDNYAFNGCSSLTEITIPASVDYFGWHVFEFCENLTTVTFETSMGNGPKIIGDSMFSGCTALTTVNLPDTVTTISNNAFDGCTALTEITIPRSVTQIGGYAFSGCSGIEDVYFEGSEAEWALVNIAVGNELLENAVIHFAIDQTEGTYGELTYRSYGDHIVITDCAVGAEHVEIPAEIDGIPVRIIDKDAFNHENTALTSLTIPKTVTTFYESQLTSCTALTDIYYNGKMEEWNAAGVTESGYPYLTAEIHFTELGFSSACEGYFTYCNFGTHIEITGVTSEYELGVTEIEIPAEINGMPVTRIESQAFNWQSGLTSVTLPDTITSIGMGAFAHCERLVSINIPDNVTSIGSSAFAQCHALTEITIPYGNTAIFSNTFAGCKNLTKITIPDSVAYIDPYTFSGCESLTDVYFIGAQSEWEAIQIGINNDPLLNAAITFTVQSEGMYDELTYHNYGDYVVITSCDADAVSIEIPAQIEGVPVTMIEDAAFEHCEKLVSVTIPDSVTAIGNGAFFACSALTNITIPDSVTSIGHHAFFRCTSLTDAVIGNGITVLNDNLFNGCTSLVNVTLPENVTVIGSSAFGDCTSLTEIDLPENLTYIGRYAFNYCISLQDVTIPDKTETIEASAFTYCNNLTSIHIPASVTLIGNYAFSGTSLTEITVDSENPRYSSLDGVLFDKDQGTLLRCPDAKTGVYTVPDSVIEIDTWAFLNCTGLTEIILPETLTAIGNAAFAQCTGLTSITIPAGVTSITTSALNCGQNLTEINAAAGSTVYSSIDGVLFSADGTELLRCPTGKSGVYTVPDGVTTIAENAFSNCSQLTEIIMPDSVTDIGTHAFTGCDGLTSLTIPDGVTELDSIVISDCESLKEIIIPKSVTLIYNYAIIECPSLTTISYEGTKAEWNAIVNYTPLTDVTIRYNYGTQSMLADLNNDGVIDATDAALLLRAAAAAGVREGGILTADQELCADVNGDGAYNAIDAAWILRYAAYNGTGGTDSIEDFLAENTGSNT